MVCGIEYIINNKQLKRKLFLNLMPTRKQKSFALVHLYAALMLSKLIVGFYFPSLIRYFCLMFAFRPVRLLTFILSNILIKKSYYYLRLRTNHLTFIRWYFSWFILRRNFCFVFKTEVLISVLFRLDDIVCCLLFMNAEGDRRKLPIRGITFAAIAKDHHLLNCV